MNLNKTLSLSVWLTMTAGTALAGGGTARVQVIHNCADAAAASVDVWLDNTLLLDNFAFRTASPFVDAPAGVDFTVGIAPPNSTMASDAIFQQTFNLTSGSTYVVVASGIVSPNGYNPSPAFSLAVFDQGEEAAALPANTDVLVYHGSTDAPTVDVYESAALNATAVDDAAYGEFAGYLALPTNDYVLQVRDAAQTTIVATYAAPLATLGLNGAALTVLASGFLDPANNNNGPAFGLFAALPSGGALVPLPSLPNPSARVQVIHNCADLAASTVDVYLNDALLIDDFAFRTATPFIDAPATIDLTVGIAPPNSTSSTDAIATFTYNLADGGRYIITANGIVSGTGYSPVAPFDLYVQADARETAALPGNTDILVFHGCTDAPTVDVGETAVLGGATLVNDLAYGGYAGYLEVPANDYVLQVRTADGTPLVSYQAPLSTLGLQGAAISVLASGFLDPAMNSNGPGFGLWVALASGGPLVELPIATGIAIDREPVTNLALAPNPAVDLTFLHLTSRKDMRATVEVVDMTGRAVSTVVDTWLLEGTNRLELPTTDLAAGLYQVLVRSGDSRAQLPLEVVR